MKLYIVIIQKVVERKTVESFLTAQAVYNCFGATQKTKNVKFTQRVTTFVKRMSRNAGFLHFAGLIMLIANQETSGCQKLTGWDLQTKIKILHNESSKRVSYMCLKQADCSFHVKKARINFH